MPVLLTKEIKTNLDLLLNLRTQVGVADSNPFVFATLADRAYRHVRGSDALRYLAAQCGAKSPSLLTLTNLRKHIATVSQILNLKENELDILAKFLGLDIRIHRDYYRLPNDHLQVAKVSRILLAIEKGTLHNFKGQILDEMDAIGSIYIGIIFLLRG